MSEPTHSEDHVQYRYGDATPFPIQENFIDTLLGATDVCVALFKADASASERRKKASTARQDADQDLETLEKLAGSIESVLAPHLPEDKNKPSGALQTAAKKLAQNARSTMKQARKSINKERETKVRAALGKVLSDSAWQTLEQFLAQCQFPGTDWAVRWRGGPKQDQARLEISARTKFDLEARFDGDVPATSPWSGPRKVGDLAPGLSMYVPSAGGLFGKREGGQVKRQRLDRFAITEVYTGPDRDVLVLRSPGKQGDGLGIILRRGNEAEPVMSQLGPEGEVVGDPIPVSSEDAMTLRELWLRVAPEIRALTVFRSSLLSAKVRGTPVSELDHPATLAESMLGTIAPVVREMRLRSRVPGELVIKREIGDGRREELYVPRDKLQKKFAHLPDHYRDVFEAMGLGNDATADFASKSLFHGDTSRDLVA